jgi:hypothetical protein
MSFSLKPVGRRREQDSTRPFPLGTQPGLRTGRWLEPGDLAGPCGTGAWDVRSGGSCVQTKIISISICLSPFALP